jgi:hypothetical protein
LAKGKAKEPETKAKPLPNQSAGVIAAAAAHAGGHEIITRETG